MMIQRCTLKQFMLLKMISVSAAHRITGLLSYIYVHLNPLDGTNLLSQENIFNGDAADR
uniref:Uncharacterized protein n=1 Tax=Manihot esculenta TaxID=3983 RepID=A0A2C9VZP8_MANES